MIKGYINELITISKSLHLVRLEWESFFRAAESICLNVFSFEEKSCILLILQTAPGIFLPLYLRWEGHIVPPPHIFYVAYMVNNNSKTHKLQHFCFRSNLTVMCSPPPWRRARDPSGRLPSIRTYTCSKLRCNQDKYG